MVNMEMNFLRHRGSSMGNIGQKGSRRSVSAPWGDLEWPPSAAPGAGPPEVMFEVLFREPDLLFRLFGTSGFVCAFAYIGASKLAFISAIYVLLILVSAYCYYRGSVFASSVVLCTSTTVLDLFLMMFTGGLSSSFLHLIPMCPSMTIYCIGPKCGIATAVLLLPCVLAMIYIPQEWNELEYCLSTHYSIETKKLVLLVIHFFASTVCMLMHCGLMFALMLNLQEGYENRLKIRLEVLTYTAQAVEEANRFRRDFVASISHELRTPMNAICGACESLLNECKNTDDTGWISLIDTSARTLLALVNDIISVVATQQYVSPGRKRIQMQNIPCDFPSLIKDVIRTARLSPKTGVEIKPLEIELSAQQVCDDSGQVLLGDPDRFRQIVTHLVSNAVKFTEKGCVRVTLSCRPTSPEVSTNRVLLLVAVTDTGIGIASDKLSEIFEPFSQLDGTATRRYGGTGVGLTISRNLAEIMKGSITVVSEQGRGSRFLFSCPVLVEKNIAPIDIDDNSHRSTCSNVSSSSSSSNSVSSGGSFFSDTSYRSRLSLSSFSSGSSSLMTCSPNDSPASQATHPELDLSLCSGSGTETKMTMSDGFLVSPLTRAYSPASEHSSVLESTSSDTISVSEGTICGGDGSSSSGDDSSNSGGSGASSSSNSGGSGASSSSNSGGSGASSSSGSGGSGGGGGGGSITGGEISGSSTSPVIGKRKRDEVEQYTGQMVIVVDDNAVNVRVLSNHLRRLGLTVETAVNGEEAVEVAKTHGARASCIFMDIMMPVMDGFQATREIRRLGNEDLDLEFLKDVPIYACTTLDSREEFSQAGMNGSLLKPVHFVDIQNVLREITAKSLPLVPLLT